MTTIAFLATLFGGPVRLARAVETAEPADTPNFSEATNGVRGGVDVASSAQKATKARKAPVSANGSFTHSLSIQVPPGRLGMTPSLGLGYDSSSVGQSPVGAGWSLGTARISRSTRLGYPAVGGPVFDRKYLASSAIFTGPDGELTPSTDGPTGATGLFAPVRETSAVRYEFVSAQDRWVEHEPSGVKKYYGADPFDSRAMRVVNELGTFSWLLLREEDPHGNFIKYDYHNASEQSRTDRSFAQTAPILSRVEWGGNRLTGQASPFAVTTLVEQQAGPLNVLDGNTFLSHRIHRIEVAIDGAMKWSYTLGYITSAETGKSLLRTFSRDQPAETTTFTYSAGAPSGARFEAMGPLHVGASDKFYTEGSDLYRGPFNLELGKTSFESAVQAPGHRAGTKFVDIDGNGTTDAIYHGAGIGTTSTHILWEESRLQESATTGVGNWLFPDLGNPSGPSTQPTTGLPYFPRDGEFSRSDFPEATLRELVDVDGDGDLDGISLPLTLIPRNGNGVLVPLPAAHYPPLRPPGEMPITIHTNSARAGEVSHPETKVPWPPGVDVASLIFATVDEAEPPPRTIVHKVEPQSDINAPPVDLNGDGKTDLVLLKHRANMGMWSPGAAFAAPLVAIMRMYSWIKMAAEKAGKAGARGGLPGIPPLGEINKGDIGKDIDGLVRNDHAFVFVDRGLLNTAIKPQEYVVLNVPAKTAGIPELEPNSPIVLITGLPGLPHSGGGGAPIPPVGPPETPEIIDYLQEKPWWYPVQDPEGDVWLPLRDNYFLGPDALGSTAFYGDFHYVPRAYLMRGEATRQLVSEGENRTSYFDASLQAHLNNGSPDECRTATCAFPSHVNFNTFFADLNGDGLPDLVKAPTPYRFVDAEGERLVCPNGHEVYLNRGYGFELAQNSLVTLYYGASETIDSHANRPLRRVANRDRACHMERPRMGDTVVGSDNGGPRYPLAATAQTDINADGRVDFIIAYQTKEDDLASVEQAVYLNTGRGFQQATAFILPREIALARDVMYPSQPGSTANRPNPHGTAWPRDGLADTARFVDLDGDGLVDIVSAGACARIDVFTERCNPPVWYRNRGNIPDRLERVDEYSGAWTSIEYAGPKSGIVTVPEGGLKPAPTARFVSKVRSAAGPAAVPVGYDSFPVEEVRVSYENYVRDVVSNEHIGFERVHEEFVNSFDGVELETVRVTQTFDIRPQLQDSAGVTVPVRHPLKGAQVSVVSESGSWMSAEVREYRVDTLGSGARIRPSRTLTGESGASAPALWAAEDSREFDSYGNPTLTVSGNFNGADIGLGPERRTTRTTYENRTDARWQIGLASQQRSFGYSEDVNGNISNEKLLAETSTDYDTRGSVAATTRLNVTSEFCDGPVNDTTTYEYWPHGQVKVSHAPNSRNVTTTYDAKNLYPARVETRVGKMIGGVFTYGTTILADTFETDLRTGKRTWETGPDGSTTIFSYDASGRMVSRTLCSAMSGGTCSTSIVVETNVYTDIFPVNVTSTLRHDFSVDYYRVAYADGDGHVLAVAEGESSGNKSLRDRTRYDAFGRAREAYLPKFIATFADAAKAPSGPRVTTSYDGFDRPRMVRRADSTTTSYEYEPRVAIETNARGVVTRRTYDTFGALALVERNPDGSPSERSTHSVVRDGLGAVVRVVDGDGSVRRIERDGGGRIRYLTLPANPSSSPAKFSLCHDVDDRLVRLETPAGRTVTTLYDELGRPVVTEGTDDSGLFVQNTQVYDEAVAGGLGHLTSKNDESGAYKMTYDGFGRPASLRFDPSARAKAGATNVASSYTVGFTYSPGGQLKSTVIGGLPSAAELRYTRDARGRATKVESKQGAVWTTIADVPIFDADERLTSVRFGNLTTGEWTYGALTERLDAITYKTSAGATLAAVTHTYDENGNPQQEQRFRQGTAGVHSQKIHSYDKLDRLVSSESQSPAGNHLERYTFSPGGNLLTGGGDIYAYNSPVTTQAASRLSNATTGMTRTLAYEPDGFLRIDTKVEGGTTDTRTLSFDPFGCIRRITKEEFGGTQSSAMSDYTCGLDGRVVARATTKADGSRSRRIDVAGVGEIRADDGVFVIRAPLAGTVSVEDARLLSDGTRSVALSGYLVEDARGSVLATTAWDSDTTISREAEYDAWGQKIGGYSALATPRHGFVGAEADAAAGTYSFGARTYDPSLRRWVSPDPLLAALPNADLHLGDALNLYGYADGNPIKHTDRSGYSVAGVLEVVSIGVAVASGVIALGSILASDDAKIQQKLHPAHNPGQAVLMNMQMMGGVLGLAGGGAAAASAGAESGGTALAGEAAPAVKTGAETAAKAEAAAPGVQGAAKAGGNTAAKVESTTAKVAAETNCFVAGTLIAAENDLLPIEVLKPGNLVWARDELTGETALREVVRTFEHDDVLVVLVSIEDDDGGRETIAATVEHPFRVLGEGWVSARALRPGARVETRAGRPAHVVSVADAPSHDRVYNIEVASAHTYFVGRTAVWVHNASKLPPKTGNAGTKGGTADVVTANGQRAAADGTRLGPSGKPEFHNSNSATRKQAIDAAKADPKGSGQIVKDKATPKQAPHYHPIKSNGDRVSGPGKTHYNKAGDKPRPQ